MPSRRKPKSKSPKDAIRAHYEPRISSSRPHHEILDWASPVSQHARFEVLARNVDLQGRSLLDVGSGMGDLLAFLNGRGLQVDYTGVDIVEKMVEAARRCHPDGTFIHADIFQDNPFPPKSFDVVFCSGALNLNLGNNRDFLPHAIDIFMLMARQCVAFNLLHKRAESDDPRYFYHEPQEVRELLKPYRCKVAIIDNYLPNDFTVLCTKLG